VGKMDVDAFGGSGVLSVLIYIGLGELILRMGCFREPVGEYGHAGAWKTLLGIPYAPWMT